MPPGKYIGIYEGTAHDNSPEMIVIGFFGALR